MNRLKEGSENNLNATISSSGAYAFTHQVWQVILNRVGEVDEVHLVLENGGVSGEIEELPGALHQRSRRESHVHGGELVERVRDGAGVGALRRVHRRRPLARLAAEEVGEPEQTTLRNLLARLLHGVPADRRAEGVVPPRGAARWQRP